MSYLYKSHCYDTTTELFSVVASDCPLYSDGEKIIQCTPTQSGVDVSITDLSTSTTQSYSITPVQIPCAPNLTSVIDLSWQIVLVFIVAWGIRQLALMVKTT